MRVQAAGRLVSGRPAPDPARMGSPRTRRAVASTRWFLRAVPLLALAGGLLGAPAGAARTPSPELAFRVNLAPDSITVGDPIALTLEATGPAGAILLLPQVADSIGPFTVLDAGPPVAASSGGKVTVSRTAKVTRFRTDPATFPELELLWVRSPGDTALALSSPIPVRVGSLMNGPADPSKLKDLKSVVPLARPRWWLWGLIAVGAALLAFAAWRFRHLLRRRRAVVEAPAPPPLPPEVAFERGLAALLAEALPEHGRVKDFYVELSLLFRRYLEDRFGFLAVEETRREIMAAVERRSDLAAAEVNGLQEWLVEDELVKFAKLERLLADVSAHTDRARAWVRATTPARSDGPSTGTPVAVAGGSAAPPAAPPSPEVRP